MGVFYTSISLENPRFPDLRRIEVQALADTGSMFVCIPEHVAIQLQLEEIERREVTVADGSRHVCPYVGPIQLRVGNRSCFTGALVLGNVVIMGAIAMEDMDLVVFPLERKIGPNPLSPNIPHGIVMQSAPALSVER